MRYYPEVNHAGTGTSAWIDTTALNRDCPVFGHHKIDANGCMYFDSLIEANIYVIWRKQRHEMEGNTFSNFRIIQVGTNEERSCVI